MNRLALTWATRPSSNSGKQGCSGNVNDVVDMLLLDRFDGLRPNRAASQVTVHACARHQHVAAQKTVQLTLLDPLAYPGRGHRKETGGIFHSVETRLRQSELDPGHSQAA